MRAGLGVCSVLPAFAHKAFPRSRSTPEGLSVVGAAMRSHRDRPVVTMGKDSGGAGQHVEVGMQASGHLSQGGWFVVVATL
jgi:hypothetical protein